MMYLKLKNTHNVFTFRNYKRQCQCYNSLQSNIHEQCEVKMQIECDIGKTTLLFYYFFRIFFYYKFMLFLC